jgi:formyltetrahydrofolate deformylase
MNTLSTNPSTSPHPGYILTIICPDRPGIVYAVSQFLFEQQCNIADSAQYTDHFSGRFFMRIHFEQIEKPLLLDLVKESFSSIQNRFQMDAKFYNLQQHPRVLIMVSKFGHCLNDLLFRTKSGSLPIEISGIGSNHHDFNDLAKSYQIPYHFFPITSATDGRKNDVEQQLLDLIEKENIDLVVLARYMQILSPRLCEALAGKVINIHHSFLPSFKGAKPYLQAHQRGVKLIGATAHYVTTDLDEGPIIEQEISRVNHSMTPDQLTAIGRDVESMALARAIQWHAEHRILLNGKSTVIFQ